jgi:hypothetical protein
MGTLLDVLPHVCNVRRRKRTGDAVGGFTDDYNTVVSDGVPCWRQSMSDKEISYWEGRNIEITDKVFFDHDPKVGADCVLEFVDADNTTEILDVQSEALPDDSVGFGVLWRVVCKRIFPVIT